MRLAGCWVLPSEVCGEERRYWIPLCFCGMYYVFRMYGGVRLISHLNQHFRRVFFLILKSSKSTLNETCQGHIPRSTTQQSTNRARVPEPKIPKQITLLIPD